MWVKEKILATISFNPFPNKPWFLRVCSTSLLKTLREKEKLLVTSNFSFSHSVFYLFGELSAIFNELEIVVCKLFQFGRVQNLSFGKGLKLSQQCSLPFYQEIQLFWQYFDCPLQMLSIRMIVKFFYMVRVLIIFFLFSGTFSYCCIRMNPL